MRQGDQVAGRYRLEELQGHGPMSEVWRAHDDTLDRTVALKILAPTADLARFRREARALAGLAHENIMRLYDYGEADVGPYMALEWLPGGTLEERLTGEPLPAAETRSVAEGIAAGLAQLHARGLVHRDLKPANVLFDEEGRTKLADFGLARSTAGAGTLTEAGTVLGTAAYISPEQAAGEPAGAPSDVYSFGVILFRMLTGALPFAAGDALSLVNMHRYASPPAVEALQPDAPPELAALAAAAMTKDPSGRPANGTELLAALGGAPPTSTSAAETGATRILPAAGEQPGGRAARRRAAVAAAVVLLAAAGGVLAWAVSRPAATAPAGTPTTTPQGGTAQGAPTTRRTSTEPETRPKPTTSAGPAHTRPAHTRPATTAATTTQRTTTSTPTTSRTTTRATTTTQTNVPTTTTIPTTTTSTSPSAGTTTAITGTT